MSVEVLPLGMKCQLSCDYCYQRPVRDARNAGGQSYDMDAMKAALLAEGWKFTVFGGEPLLVPVDDLAELWRFGHETFGEAARAAGGRSNGIQSNGALLTDRHVRLMKKYDVGVGLSIDGPGELNDGRSAGSEDETRKATEASLAALRRLLAELPTPPSLIVTVHRVNASPERLPRLLEWLEELHALGLRNLNVHLLERDTPEAFTESLTETETVAAMWAIYQLGKRIGLHVEPMADMVKLLAGDDEKVSCIWNGCDPYTTDAVRGVGPHGERLNCGRTYKDGVLAIKADVPGFERYVALAQTPQTLGGCAGCRFFFACKGNCPGTAEDGDWRARTEHCGVLMELFGRLELEAMQEGRTPFSLDIRRPIIEAMMVEQWKQGARPTVRGTIEAYGRGDTWGEVGMEGHQDVPHGDSHGDSDSEEWVAAHQSWRKEPEESKS